MNYIIREIRESEYYLLADFLYEPIYIPQGMKPPAKSIIANTELQLYIDHKTPSFAISIYRDYRGLGIGTEMMTEMLTLLKESGYKKAYLAVQKVNYAVKMYENLGFKIVGENSEEYIMAKCL